MASSEVLQAPYPAHAGHTVQGRIIRLSDWLAPLFPRSAVPVTFRFRVVAGYVAAFFGLTVVILERQSGYAATHTMWAEDGRVFYQSALAHSFPSTLVTLYNGYAQFFPRLAMALVGKLPVRDASSAIALIGAMTLAAITLIVFYAAKGHIPSPECRVILAASVVLLPLATGELLNNIVNTSWWFLFACFWALLWRPSTRSGMLIAGAVCFLASSSDPVSAVFLPLAFARLLAFPSARESAPTIGLLTGLIFQGAAITAGGSSGVGQSSNTDLFQLLSIRVWLGQITGVQWTNWIVLHSYTIGAIAGVVAITLSVTVVIVRRNRSIGLFAGFALVLGSILYLGEIGVRGASAAMAHSPVANGGRYDAVPLLLALSTLVVAVTGQVTSARRGLTGALVLVLVLTPTWWLGYRFPNGRSGGPDWSAEVVAATRACSHAPDHVESLSIDPAGWSVQVPCTRLLPAGR
jgi:hypothetical protein